MEPTLNTLDKTTPTAVVTGGSRGIGRAVALALARDGYQILLTYVSRPAQAEAVVEEIRAQGGKAACACLNVGDAGAVTAFFRDQVKDNVNLACLVNNAGVTRDGFLIRMKDEDFDAVLNVNLRGTFVASREAARIMSRNRAGCIVNISSVVGQMGNAGQANYSASKAGIIGLTKSNAKELAARGVRVNAVAPGFIETEMTAVLSEEQRKAYTEAIPLKRLGSAEDIADAVAFLASPKAAYITGQVLAVNGGMYC